MNFGNDAKIDAARVIAYSAIDAGGAYGVVGSAITTPYRGIVISSTLNQTVWITNDTTKDQILLPSSATFLGVGINFFDMGLNRRSGDQWYIKHDGVAPTAGKLALTIIHE